MATNLRRKISVFGGQIFIVALQFGNGLEYQNGNGLVISAFIWRSFKRRCHGNVATSYTNLARFGLLTPEFRSLIFVLCEKKLAKLAPPP